jgi:hypothetical protein
VQTIFYNQVGRVIDQDIAMGTQSERRDLYQAYTVCRQAVGCVWSLCDNEGWIAIATRWGHVGIVGAVGLSWVVWVVWLVWLVWRIGVGRVWSGWSAGSVGRSGWSGWSGTVR